MQSRFPKHFQSPHRPGVEGFLEEYALLGIRDYLDGYPEAAVGESEDEAWAEFFCSDLFYYAYKLSPLVWSAVRTFAIPLDDYGFVEYEVIDDVRRTRRFPRPRKGKGRHARKLRTEIIAQEGGRKRTFSAIASCARHYRVSEDTVRWALKSMDGRLGPRAESLKGRYVYITKGRTFYSR